MVSRVGSFWSEHEKGQLLSEGGTYLRHIACLVKYGMIVKNENKYGMIIKIY